MSMIQFVLINEIKEKYNLETDVEVAELLNVSKQTVGKWKDGVTQFGPDNAMKIAELLEIDPEKISADMMMMRSKNSKVANKWRERGTLLSIGLIPTTCWQFTSQFNEVINQVCILC